MAAIKIFHCKIQLTWIYNVFLHSALLISATDVVEQNSSDPQNLTSVVPGPKNNKPFIGFMDLLKVFNQVTNYKDSSDIVIHLEKNLNSIGRRLKSSSSNSRSPRAPSKKKITHGTLDAPKPEEIEIFAPIKVLKCVGANKNSKNCVGPTKPPSAKGGSKNSRAGIKRKPTTTAAPEDEDNSEEPPKPQEEGHEQSRPPEDSSTEPERGENTEEQETPTFSGTEAVESRSDMEHSTAEIPSEQRDGGWQETQSSETTEETSPPRDQEEDRGTSDPNS